jgi:hypothetical protein
LVPHAGHADGWTGTRHGDAHGPQATLKLAPSERDELRKVLSEVDKQGELNFLQELYEAAKDLKS